MRILHVLPDTAADPKHLHLGSTKDIRGRTEYFKSRDLKFDELITRRSDDSVIAALGTVEISNYDTVIIETIISPAAIRYLRSRAPRLVIMTRSINAELLHRFDWVRAGGFGWPHKWLQKARFILSRFLRDYHCAMLSDHLLSITDWEVERYWKKFAERRKVVSVPFFMPSAYVTEPVKTYEKRHQCVCLMSTGYNPLIIDAARNFAGAVTLLGDRAQDWSFFITCNQSEHAVPMPARVRSTGVLQDPYQMLGESRAMALLSDYGYGFKTKFLEAVMCQSFILIPRGLYRRVPAAMLPFCIEVDPRSASSFADALDACRRPYPASNPNEEFRQQAFQNLDTLLLNHP